MKKYLITYDLKNHASYNNYTNLHNTIKNVSGFWCHYLESTWMVKVQTKTASQISKELLIHIDQTKDFLLVIEIDSTDKGGWLPKKAWDWLNS